MAAETVPRRTERMTGWAVDAANERGSIRANQLRKGTRIMALLDEVTSALGLSILFDDIEETLQPDNADE